jgi:GNAT superfamily N-acetyltransferase
MIRVATPDDFSALLDLGRKMHAESRYREYSLDDDKLLQHFNAARANGFLIVFERVGKVEAGFLAGIGEMWFGRDLAAFDLAMFVQPDRRGGFIAAMMIEAYIEWAIQSGAKEISIGTTTGVNTEAACRLYEKVGFEPVGSAYRMRV